MEVTMKSKPVFELTGAQLKFIALLTMFVDHIGAALLEHGVLRQISDAVLAGNSFDFTVADYRSWYQIDLILRLIGRVAFPLFCFLLVEGFLHTRQVTHYALRLGIFALISEIPFDLAFNDSILEVTSQNVFFTLFLGVLVLRFLQYFETSLPAPMLPLRYLVAITGMLFAHFLQTDYAAYGILLIVFLYETRKNRKWQCLGGAFLTLLQSYTAAIAFLLIYFYNGKRGKQFPKYLVYAFYPAHLLFLFLLRTLLLS